MPPPPNTKLQKPRAPTTPSTGRDRSSSLQTICHPRPPAAVQNALHLNLRPPAAQRLPPTITRNTRACTRTNSLPSAPPLAPLTPSVYGSQRTRRPSLLSSEAEAPYSATAPYSSRLPSPSPAPVRPQVQRPSIRNFFNLGGLLGRKTVRIRVDAATSPFGLSTIEGSQYGSEGTGGQRAGNGHQELRGLQRGAGDEGTFSWEGWVTRAPTVLVTQAEDVKLEYERREAMKTALAGRPCAGPSRGPLRESTNVPKSQRRLEASGDSSVHSRELAGRLPTQEPKRGGQKKGKEVARAVPTSNPNHRQRSSSMIDDRPSALHEMFSNAGSDRRSVAETYDTRSRTRTMLRGTDPRKRQQDQGRGRQSEEVGSPFALLQELSEVAREELRENRGRKDVPAKGGPAKQGKNDAQRQKARTVSPLPGPSRLRMPGTGQAQVEAMIRATQRPESSAGRESQPHPGDQARVAPEVGSTRPAPPTATARPPSRTATTIPPTQPTDRNSSQLQLGPSVQSVVPEAGTRPPPPTTTATRPVAPLTGRTINQPQPGPTVQGIERPTHPLAGPAQPMPRSQPTRAPPVRGYRYPPGAIFPDDPPYLHIPFPAPPRLPLPPYDIWTPPFPPPNRPKLVFGNTDPPHPFSLQSAHPVTYEGNTYRTALNLYFFLRLIPGQHDPKVVEEFRKTADPKGLAGRCKGAVMWSISPGRHARIVGVVVRHKVAQHEVVASELLKTGQAELWDGEDTCMTGGNLVGKALMECRAELSSSGKISL